MGSSYDVTRALGFDVSPLLHLFIHDHKSYVKQRTKLGVRPCRETSRDTAGTPASPTPDRVETRGLALSKLTFSVRRLREDRHPPIATDLLDAVNGRFRHVAVHLTPHSPKLPAHVHGAFRQFMLGVANRQNEPQHLFALDLHAAEALASPGKPFQLDRSSN